LDSQVVVMPNPRPKGVILVLIGASFWGISGTVAQFLFQKQGFSVSWLVVIRLLFAGLGLLLFSRFVGKQNIWTIWKNKSDVLQLVVFGIIGMLGVQYTYFAAVKEGNAATATIIQYLAPVMITCYLCFRSRVLPAKHEIIAIGLALLGTFFLVTNGNIQALSISGPAFVWGILSAFALAFYTLYPRKLLNTWGSLITTGWGMLIGGVVFSFFQPPWQFSGSWSFSALMAVLFVVIFGTLVAFFCYMESLKYIEASEASLLACVEPLSAAFLAVAWLHVPFGVFEWIGAASILATIFILSAVKRT